MVQSKSGMIYPPLMDKRCIALEAVVGTTRVMPDQVDYIIGNRRANEMVGAVLSQQIIRLVRDALDELDNA